MAEINEYENMTFEKYRSMCERLDAKWEQYQKELKEQDENLRSRRKVLGNKSNQAAHING